MKHSALKKFITIVCIFCFLFISCNSNNKKKKSDFSSDDITKQYYYSMGNYMASVYSSNLEDMDFDAYIEGMKDYINGIKMEENEIEAIVNKYNEKILKEMGEKNLQQAEAFLKDNAEKEGVIVTESGLQYKVLEEGTGDSPDENCNVTVIYTLTLQDGTMMDSSYGQEVTFSLKDVVPGFAEAVMKMKVGSHIIAYVHPSLGYGDSSMMVEPQSLLIFDIELVSFEEVQETDE